MGNAALHESFTFIIVFFRLRSVVHGGCTRLISRLQNARYTIIKRTG